MQWTIRNIPKDVDRALRAKAKASGASLNSVVVEAMRRGAGLDKPLTRRRDLGKFAGSWVDDAEMNAALRDQDRIDPEMWK